MHSEHPSHYDAQKVGVREFRENLASFIEGSEPVAVTKHGETVGYYIPTKPKPHQQDRAALLIASEKMQALLKDMSTSEEVLVSEYEAIKTKDKHRP
ncbi:MAG: hypothetical protein V4629_06780 [Pseudomonadota bacterium]